MFRSYLRVTRRDSATALRRMVTTMSLSSLPTTKPRLSENTLESSVHKSSFCASFQQDHDLLIFLIREIELDIGAAERHCKHDQNLKCYGPGTQNSETAPG